MKILGFDKKEGIWVIVVLVVLGFAIYFNLQVSLRRGRDIQRKNDMESIEKALLAYFTDNSSFPPSFEGKMVACLGGYDGNKIPQARACDWFTDPLTNIWSGTTYLPNIPTDPNHNEGARYYYVSNGRYFQLYTALEGKDEDEYTEAIARKNIMCGNVLCNYGRSSFGAPLDKSIEEYENELRMQGKK